MASKKGRDSNTVTNKSVIAGKKGEDSNTPTKNADITSKARGHSDALTKKTDMASKKGEDSNTLTKQTVITSQAGANSDGLRKKKDMASKEGADSDTSTIKENMASNKGGNSQTVTKNNDMTFKAGGQSDALTKKTDMASNKGEDGNTLMRQTDMTSKAGGDSDGLRNKTDMASTKGGDSQSCLFCAAIDFGTTHTGYAFIERDKLSPSSTIPVEQRWQGGQNIYVRAPTSCLFDKDKKFVSFGFEAQNTYNLLAFKNKAQDCYYFKNFKMILHYKEQLTKKTVAKDINGKTMLAFDVFKGAIQYTVELIMKKIHQSFGKKVPVEIIDWVITVPAIWDDAAKQFMREASIEAGIPNERLKLAFEPEAAAVYCKNLAVIGTTGVKAFNPCEKFIIVDMGGGTVDTAVFSVASEGKLLEEHAAHGGPWGGKKINDSFEEDLQRVVGEEFLHNFKKTHKHAWIKLEEEFELKKKEFLNKAGQDTLVSISGKFKTLYTAATKEFLEATLNNLYHGLFGFDETNDTFVISREKMNEYFNFVLKHIKDHINTIVKDVPDVTSIFLVGGLAESTVITDSIHTTYSKLTVIVPKDAAFAILRGALVYRWDPDVILNRISPYTYGVDATQQFDSKRHPKEKIVEINGRKMVKDVFHKHIEKGKKLAVGERSKSRYYKLSVAQTTQRVKWNIFRSDASDPVFCDECEMIGSISVDIEKRDQTCRLALSMQCIGSELQIIVKNDDTGKELMQRKVDFLENATTVSSDFISE